MAGQKEACILCGHSDFETVIEGADRLSAPIKGKFRIARCRCCGLVCTFPYVSPEETSKFYENYYFDGDEGIGNAGMYPVFGAFSSAFCRLYSRLLYRKLTRCGTTPISIVADPLLSFLTMPFYRLKNLCFPYSHRPGRLLDIGCGSGRLLAQQKALGWETFGIEIGEKLSAFAREKLKLNIFVGTLRDADLPEGYFDVVSMQHVMEHFLDPRAELDMVRKVLKPGGIVVLKIPHLSNVERVIFGARWSGYALPQHRFHFTKRTLTMLLKKADFVPLKVVTTLSMNIFMLSIRNILEDAGAPLWLRLKFNVDNKILRIFLLPLIFVLRITGQSGELLAYAAKDGVDDNGSCGGNL